MKKMSLYVGIACSALLFWAGSSGSAMVEFTSGKKTVEFNDVKSALTWRDKQCPLSQVAFDDEARVEVKGDEKTVPFYKVVFVEKKNGENNSEILPFASKEQAESFARENKASIVSLEDLAARAW